MADENSTTLFENGFIRGSFLAIKDALLLRTGVYTAVTEAPIPSRRGFGILLVVLVTASLAQMIGGLLNSRAIPQIDTMQETVYQGITSLTVFVNMSANNPGLFNFFSTIYDFFWMLLRWSGGYFSPAGVLFMSLMFIISNIFIWLTYGFLGYYVAKLFGAKVEKMGDYLGLMGLVFAPFILYVAEIIPGFAVPAMLVTVWCLAMAYQAIKSTYDLSWWRTVLVVLLPFPLNTILLTLTIRLGVFIGVTVSKWMMS